MASSPSSWTVRRMLAWIAQDLTALGVQSARLDAELLLSFALEQSRVALYLDLERPLSAAELTRIKALVLRRRKREPVAYILGAREFFRREFAVGPAVLIPRPDTETLVERALALMPDATPCRVLDLCTGSGAIAVTLAAERPSAQLTATDVSEAALAVARTNAERHGVSARVEFLCGDLFQPLPAAARFELIVANPPYVSHSELAGLAPEIRLHEPELALAAGLDGLAHLSRLCAGVAAYLSADGSVLFEVGQGQADAVRALLSAAGFAATSARRDLGGVERVIEGSLSDPAPAAGEGFGDREREQAPE